MCYNTCAFSDEEKQSYQVCLLETFGHTIRPIARERSHKEESMTEIELTASTLIVHVRGADKF